MAVADMAPPARLLYTVGHTNHTAESFFELLRRYRIFDLVDVRSIPSSGRFPHFKKRELDRACRERGISYMHCPELGNKVGGICNLLQKPEGQERLLDLVARSKAKDGDWADR